MAEARFWGSLRSTVWAKHVACLRRYAAAQRIPTQRTAMVRYPAQATLVLR